VPPLVKDPIYLQLNKALRGLLARPDMKAGRRFLTERQVCDRFGVSRPTANKALSNLVAEGLLEFRKGVGTFVRNRLLDYDQKALVSFTDKARAAGKKPETRVLEFRTVAASAVPPHVAAVLDLKPSENAYYVERLRLADDAPVILERRYMQVRFCPGLRKADLTGSLYALWTERFKLDVAGADQVIRAVSLRGRDARLLQARSGEAALRVTSVGYLGGGRPLWWERTMYRGDAYEFQNRLGPIHSDRPAAGVLRNPDASSG